MKKCFMGVKVIYSREIRLIKKIGPGYGQPSVLSKGVSRFGALRPAILRL